MKPLALAGLLVAAVSLAAHAGSLWWPLDLVANFRPQLAAIGLTIGVLLILGGWKRTARIVLVVAAVDVALVGLLWMPAGPELRPEAESVRIVSFNLQAQNEQYAEVVAFLARTDADLVFLHESSRPWEEAMEEADLGFRIVRTRDDDHIFGTLVLVREPAVVEGFGFTEREPRSVEVQVGLGSGDTLAVLGVHPLSPDTELSAALRDAQLAFAANWAREQDGPAVVVGDFNAGPWSHAFRGLLDETGLRDSARGFGLQPSFPATSNPVIRVMIDHAVVSDDVAVIDRSLGPALGSDHFPLIVDLAIQ